MGQPQISHMEMIKILGGGTSNSNGTTSTTHQKQTIHDPLTNNYFFTNTYHQIISHHQPIIDMTQSNHTSTSRPSDSGGHHNQNMTIDGGGSKWASKLIRKCARALSGKDSAGVHNLLWMLNELATPYGDLDQKLASYFLQALFCRATKTSGRSLKTLATVAEKTQSFDSARKLMLKFQEVSPWTTFGHVASNGAILEALDGETKLHIIDISNTLCTQWPTFLESLATRNDETPCLKLTVVITATLVKSVMKEIGQRMEKFARLMGVPFEFHVIGGELNSLGQLTKEALGVKEDEAVAINCIGSLRLVDVDQRSDVIRMFHSLNPRVVTVVEEEADFTSTRHEFIKCLEECLNYYTLFFDMMEESFSATSNERLMLERECSRNIVRVLGCDDDQGETRTRGGGVILGECERRERGVQWSERLRRESFKPVSFSDDAIDDIKLLLKRYRTRWSLRMPQGEAALVHDDGDDDHRLSGIYLTWKEQPVVWVSAWKP